MSEEPREEAVNESRALQPIRPMQVTAVAVPLVNIDEALKIWKDFEDFKRQMLVPWGKKGTDYQRIRVSEKQPDGSWKTVDKDFPKKSAARKFAKFFGISDRILEKVRTDREDGSFMWSYTVEAWTPSGQIVTSEGACDSREKKSKKLEHDVKATAHTRAKSRAIFDLVGGGEVTAEEITLGGVTDEKEVIEAEYSEVSRSRKPLTAELESLKTYLEKEGLNTDLLEFQEYDDHFEVTPVKFLGDLWNPMNEVFKSLGGDWTREENKKLSHWRLSKPKPFTSEPTEAEPPEPTETDEEPSKGAGSYDELHKALSEYVMPLDGTLTIVPQANGFRVEADKEMYEEEAETITSIIASLGGKRVGEELKWFVPLVGSE